MTEAEESSSTKRSISSTALILILVLADPSDLSIRFATNQSRILYITSN